MDQGVTMIGSDGGCSALRPVVTFRF